MPFDPIRKRTEAEIEGGGEHFHAVKGAPQVLIELAELEEEQTLHLVDVVDGLASKGYRTLAVGRRQGEAPLQLIGFIPLYDPPREDSRAVIDEMNNFGVKVKMITGDNVITSYSIHYTKLYDLRQRHIPLQVPLKGDGQGAGEGQQFV